MKKTFVSFVSLVVKDVGLDSLPPRGGFDIPPGGR